MTELSTSSRELPDAAEPEHPHRRRLSVIWAIPAVAALVAAWLAITTLEERGPTISIGFKTAAGIEAGKTRIKHNDIELGVVDHVEPSADLSQVVVVAKMNKISAPHLTQNTKFWVVRPRFSLTSLSGLETLVSGAYIEMDPEAGPATRTFQGLEEPPVVRADVPGTSYVLKTNKLGSISAGSPIYFRGMDVGEVIGHSFTGVDAGITIRIFVRKPFDALIHDGTRFWNASGISLSTGAAGFKVEVDSLQAVLAGGIGFETPERAQVGEPSKEDTSFPLFEDRTAADDAGYATTSKSILEFDGSVEGLAIGAPVEFRGIKIGKVLDFDLEFDERDNSFHIPVLVDLEIERLHLIGGDPATYGNGALIPKLVARGLRAQLRSASLITGQMKIAFDFFPDAPPATADLTGRYPKLPTMPNALSGLTRSASQILDKLAALPLDGVVSDLRGLLQSAQGVTGSPELKESLKSLSSAIAAVDHLARSADTQVGPLLASLRQASEAADAAMKGAKTTLASATAAYGSDSRIHGDLAELLRQLQEAAKSVRILANLLEQHPEALIRGKGSAGQ